MLELTGRSTTGRQGFAKATAAMPPIPADGYPCGSFFPAGVSLSMIFGTSALWHRYKTKVPLLMCLAFVSLYRLTERIHE
jgi:hypothetical protein